MSEFPKIIHHVYIFPRNNIDKNVKKRISIWKSMHPEYTFMFWDRKKSREFIKKNYGWFLKLYDNYPYNIQRCDAVRYFILYHYGGIYTDNDLESVKCITPLLEKYKDKECILYKSANSGLLTNDFMISKPKNIFWKKVWYELVSNYNFTSFSRHLIIMYSTGPLLLDSVYDLFPLKKKYVFIIDAKYINSCDISAPKPCYNKEAYLKRYDGNSWHGLDSIVFNFFYKYYRIIIIVILIIIGLVIFFKRTKNKLKQSTGNTNDGQVNKI